MDACNCEQHQDGQPVQPVMDDPVEDGPRDQVGDHLMTDDGRQVAEIAGHISAR